MPIFEIPSGALDLSRNIALLDTNILVAHADPSDQYHEDVEVFFELDLFEEFLVAPPVLVEACGLLANRRSERIVFGLLSWLLTPGQVVILPAPHPPSNVESALGNHFSWMKRFQVDYVDAYLMEIAHVLTNACRLRPYAPIVTFDTKDYVKCSRLGYSFDIFDMKSAERLSFA